MNDADVQQIAELFTKTANLLDKMANKMLAMNARIVALEEKISKLTVTGIQP